MGKMLENLFCCPTKRSIAFVYMTAFPANRNNNGNFEESRAEHFLWKINYILCFKVSLVRHEFLPYAYRSFGITKYSFLCIFSHSDVIANVNAD